MARGAGHMTFANNLIYPWAWMVQVNGPGGAAGYWQAQEVTISQESTTFSDFASDNRGGPLPGMGTVQRDSFLQRGLVVNFFQLKRDPEAGMRRWLNRISHAGLVNGGGLKGSVVAVFGQDNSNVINARGAFPTYCEGFTVNYGPQEYVVKSVTFACDELLVSG